MDVSMGAFLRRLRLDHAKDMLVREPDVAIHEIARMKYACRACTDGVKTALGPPRVIDKSQLGVSFWRSSLRV